MKKVLALLLLCSLGFTVVGQAQPPAAGAKQRFEWKFRDDDRFQMETNTELRQTLRVTNQEELKQEQKYTLLCTYTVKQKDSENCVLEQRIDSVKVMTPAGAAPGKFYQQLEGCTLRLTLNKNNQLTRLEGYEELLKKVAGDDPNVRRVVQAMLSEETIRRSIEESFAFLPAEEIAPGQSWERKFTTSLGPLGTLTLTNVYTFEKTENEGGRLLCRISIKPAIAYAPPKSDTTGLPFQIPGGDLKATEASGTLWWDASEGKLARSELKLHLVGQMQIKAKDQEAKLDLDSEQVVEIRLVKPTN